MARRMVDSAKNGGQGSGRETVEGGLAGGTQRWRATPRDEASAQGIPQRTLAVSNVRAKKRTAGENAVRAADENSGVAASTVGRNESINQKVIGRTMTVGGSGLRGRRIFRRGIHGEGALLDEPTGEIRSGVFFEPLIEQGSDFLAQIGGVSEAREFIGLERIARSREKEFPGGLGAGLRHDNLQNMERGCERNTNALVIYKYSNTRAHRLWKAVEKQENTAGCCSGCAGDYEDPDWTAWEPEPEEEDGFSGIEGDAAEEGNSRQ